MNIWMKNLCLEAHIWSYQRVLLRHLQDDLKHATLERGVFWPLQTGMSVMLAMFRQDLDNQ